jgi:hypothetical protein
MTFATVRPDAARTASATGALHHILQMGLIGGVFSTTANAIIFTVVVDGLGVTDAALDHVQPTIILSLLGALGATGVFAVLERATRQPVPAFRMAALAVLLVSFVPDLFFAGATTAWGVPTLMAMHVASAAIMLGALTPWHAQRAGS